MPVQLLGRIGVVVDIDDGLAAFAQPKKRARKLIVVERRGDDPIGRELDEPRSDPDRVVGGRQRWRGLGGRCRTIRRGFAPAGSRQAQRTHTADFKECPTIQ